MAFIVFYFLWLALATATTSLTMAPSVSPFVTNLQNTLAPINSLNPSVKTTVAPVNPNTPVPPTDPNILVPTTDPNPSVPTTNPNPSVSTTNPNTPVPTTPPNAPFPTINSAISSDLPSDSSSGGAALSSADVSSSGVASSSSSSSGVATSSSGNVAPSSSGVAAGSSSSGVAVSSSSSDVSSASSSSGVSSASSSSTGPSAPSGEDVGIDYSSESESDGTNDTVLLKDLVSNTDANADNNINTNINNTNTNTNTNTDPNVSINTITTTNVNNVNNVNNEAPMDRYGPMYGAGTPLFPAPPTRGWWRAGTRYTITLCPIVTTFTLTTTISTCILKAVEHQVQLYNPSIAPGWLVPAGTVKTTTVAADVTYGSVTTVAPTPCNWLSFVVPFNFPGTQIVTSQAFVPQFVEILHGPDYIQDVEENCDVPPQTDITTLDKPVQFNTTNNSWAISDATPESAAHSLQLHVPIIISLVLSAISLCR